MSRPTVTYRSTVTLSPEWSEVLAELSVVELAPDGREHEDLLICGAAELEETLRPFADTARAARPLVVVADRSMDADALWTALEAGADDHLPLDLPKAALTQRLQILAFRAERRRKVDLAASLRSIEGVFRELGDVFNDIVFVTSADMSRTLYVSPALERLLGLPRETAYADAMAYFERVHPDDRAALSGLVQATSPIEHRVADADGRYDWVETRAHPVRDAHGEVVRWLGITSDISRRKQAEQEASALERLLNGATLALAKLLQASDAEEALPSVLETVGRATTAHRIYSAMHGVSASGRPTVRLTHEWHADEIPAIDDPGVFSEREASPDARAAMERLARGEVVALRASEISDAAREGLASTGARAVLMVPVLVRGRCRGHIGFIDCEAERRWSTPMRRTLQLTAAAIGAVSLREQAEREVATQSARLRSLFEATNPAATVSAQLDSLIETAVTAFGMELGTLARVDQAALECEIVRAFPAGGPLAPGASLPVSPDIRQMFAERRARLMDDLPEGASEATRRLSVRSSMTVPVFVEDEAWGILSLLRHTPRPQPSNEADRDSLELLGRLVGLLLERREAEAQRRVMDERMQESQRLESLGVLAGGVAHDFNNLLMAIMGNAEVAKLDLDDDHPSSEALSHIVLASMRAAELTQQVLTYAGKARTERDAIDVGEAVADMGELLNAALPKNATLRVAEDIAVPPIEADPTQLRQVLLNLLSNAAEALDGSAGEITVSLSAASEAPAGRIGHASDGVERWVRIEVRDDGRGMDGDTLGRALDPFFSTKAQGRGLGLAVVTGVVRSHGAVLDIDSAKGEGTTVRIHWPASTVEAPPVQPPRPASLDGLRVLVVDDEPLVLRAVESLLSRAGARVRTAFDGQDGIEAYDSEGPFDLVVLDLTMPRRHGSEVMAVLRERSPALPILVMSGYPDTQASSDAHTHFLQKPFRPPELLERVESLLVTG